MTVSTEALRDALDAIKLVAKKTSLPVTEFVRMEAMGGGALLLKANDTAVEIECIVEATELPVMDLCVPAQRLLGIVANAGDEIDFSLGKDGLALNAKSGKGRWRLPTLPGDRMPYIEASNWSQCLAEGSYATMYTELDFCQFAATKHFLARPWAGGLHVQVRNHCMEVVGSNGTSLFAHSAATVGDIAPFDIIVPMAAMQIALDEYETFKLYPGVLCLYSKARTAKIKLLSAQYPDLSGITRQDRVGGFTVNSEEFLAALEAVAPFKSGAVPPVQLRIDPSGLTVKVESATDCAEQSLPCKFGIGNAAELSFHMNLDHMIAVASQCSGEVEFYWGDGFPLKGGVPLLVKQGSRMMGSTTYKM
jgi:DNA polymerase III sliding clamp (beta) subunit (PCNA family)